MRRNASSSKPSPAAPTSRAPESATREETEATWVANQRRQELLDAGRRAMDTLQATLEQGRRLITRTEEDPSEEVLTLTGQLLAAITWGTANASVELTSQNTRVAECAVALHTLKRLRTR